MPRSLELTFGKDTFSREIEKVDRTKLYGSVELETLDTDGNACKLSTLANDGHTLIPYGGTAFGYVNPAGEWVDRSALKPVDQDGNELTLHPSSFDGPTKITEEVPIEQFLDHSVRLCYRLEETEGETAIPDAMMARLEEGAIFRIPFSYRGGVDPDTGFLLLGVKGSLWLLIAEENDIDFIGLEEAALCARDQTVEDEEDDEEDGDGLSFDML